jgi:murein DD-endopeptidase MepM/ murein hydrolase activator NlpD
MRRRRFRWPSADTVAPWVALVIVVGLGWLGAQILAWTGIGRPWATRSATQPPTYVSGSPPPPGRGSSMAATSGMSGAPPRAEPTSGTTPIGPAAPPVVSYDDVEELRSRDLTIPVQGIEKRDLESTFTDPRGARIHQAMDILAPRGTPVLAVEGGQIVKLFTSERGGLTIYQFDPTRRFAYYYAHLDAYADRLKEGQAVARGQVIGYVGTTGNAPKDTPHLHFGIFRLGPQQRWWEGAPLDPDRVWR